MKNDVLCHGWGYGESITLLAGVKEGNLALAFGGGAVQEKAL